MTPMEIFAICFFGVIGYLAVNHLLSRSEVKKTSTDEQPGSASDPGADRRNGNDDPPPSSGPAGQRHWSQVLGTSSTATIDEIRDAYRRQVGKYHPDKVAHLGEEFKVIAEQRSKEINVAYREAMRTHGTTV